MLFSYSKAAREPCYCPVNMMPVDEKVIIPNKKLRAEVQRLYKEQPWAYEFDPRVHYRKIKIW